MEREALEQLRLSQKALEEQEKRNTSTKRRREMVTRQLAALESATPASPVSSIPISADISIQESVDRVVDEMKYDPRQAERLLERAGAL